MEVEPATQPADHMGECFQIILESTDVYLAKISDVGWPLIKLHSSGNEQGFVKRSHG